MSKWSILRKALLTHAASGDDAEAAEASIHRHDGFRMIDKSLGQPPEASVEYTLPAMHSAAEPVDHAGRIFAAALGQFTEAGVDVVRVTLRAPPGSDPLLAELTAAVTEGLGASVVESVGGVGESCGSNCGGVSVTLVATRRDGLASASFVQNNGLAGQFDVVRYHIPSLQAKDLATEEGDGGRLRSPLPATAALDRPPLALRLLERRKGAKLSLAELKPHAGGHGEGVDNTGNVRIWPAEEVLLHILLGAAKRRGAPPPGTNGSGDDGRKGGGGGGGAPLQSFPSALPPAFFRAGGRRVLELGGGMTALAALGFAAACRDILAPAPGTAGEGGGGGGKGGSGGCEGREEGSEGEGGAAGHGRLVPLVGHVTATDGNPSSVESQRRNLALNGPLLAAAAAVDTAGRGARRGGGMAHATSALAARLFWEERDESGTEAALLAALRTQAAEAASTRAGGDDGEGGGEGGAGGGAGRLQVGEAGVEAQWRSGRKWYSVAVEAVHGDGTAALRYADGDFWGAVPPTKVRRGRAVWQGAPPPPPATLPGEPTKPTKPAKPAKLAEPAMLAAPGGVAPGSAAAGAASEPKAAAPAEFDDALRFVAQQSLLLPYNVPTNNK